MMQRRVPAGQDAECEISTMFFSAEGDIDQFVYARRTVAQME